MLSVLWLQGQQLFSPFYKEHFFTDLRVCFHAKLPPSEKGFNVAGGGGGIANFSHFTRETADLCGSVRCASSDTMRPRVRSPPSRATFFGGVWLRNIFYGHSLPSADSRKDFVSFWRKNVHKYLLIRLEDYLARQDLLCVNWVVKLQINQPTRKTAVFSSHQTPYEKRFILKENSLLTSETDTFLLGRPFFRREAESKLPLRSAPSVPSPFILHHENIPI